MRKVLLSATTVVVALALSAGTASAGGTGALHMLNAGDHMWTAMDNHTNAHGDWGMYCAIHMSTAGAAGFCTPHH